MKLRIRCSVCRRDDHATFASPDEKGFYPATCPAGHTTVASLQMFKWELLFESGTLAFDDGYYRESVASFAAAWEGFYLYYARVHLRARMAAAGADRDHVEAALEKMRKDLKLSERRLGAMYAIYALEHDGESFEKFDVAKRREFRNEVIHEGKWPTAEQTETYARHVFDSVAALWAECKEKYPDAASQEDLENLLSGAVAGLKGVPANPATLRSTVYQLSVLRRASQGEGFDSALAERRAFDGGVITNARKAATAAKAKKSKKQKP